MTLPRVLVIGGYGGFGARLSRRLAGDGWQVLVGGRNAAKARAFAAGLTHAVGLVVDRNAELAPVLREHRPLLVIDTAGPFQGSSYAVPQACIAAGVNYLDLADGRDFVCRIGALDQEARAAGVAVISGASSVPALSGAVVRSLTHGLPRIERIELAISASDRAVAGTSVAVAILSYAGQRFVLRHGGTWASAVGWHGLRRVRYALSGVKPLRRVVALVDVPDLELLPKRVRGEPDVTFRAGPEFALQALGIWLLSWLVTWRVVRSLAPLAPVLLHLQRLTGWACSDRSAMMVEVSGGATQRRWTLIADRGTGPEVPTLAAQLLARAILAGNLIAGARDAGEELTLDEFAPLFTELGIVTS